MLLLDASTESEQIQRIKHLKSQGDGWFKRYRERAVVRRKRYLGEHYDTAKRVQEGDERVVLNAEMRLVDKAYSLLTLEPPIISAEPEEETEEGLVEADRLESWLEGVWYTQKMRQGLDPLSLGIIDGLITGMGVWWVFWDKTLDSRSDSESDQLDQLPLVIKRRDPTKVILREGGKKERWLWCMYVDRLPVLDVELEWGLELKKYARADFAKKSREEVDVIDFWGWDTQEGEPVVVNAVLAGDQFVKKPVAMPLYKQLPAVAWFCRPAPFGEWESKGLPITASMERTAPEVESMLNSLLHATKKYAQLPLLYKGRGPRPDVPAGYDNIMGIGPEDDLGFLTWPGHPPDLYRIYELLQGEVDQGGFGAPLQGPTPASPSGYALSIRGEAGTLSLVAPQQSLSIALTEMLQKTCSLCASFAPDLEMRVFGKHENQRKVFALTGSQMQGWFINVAVSAIWPEDKDKKVAWGLSLAANPQAPLDQRTIIEDFFGYPNADQIQQRKLIDMARMHPAVQIYQLVQALQKRGADEYIPLILQQESQGQGSPSAPGAPNVPVPGVGTQIMPQESLGAMRSQELGGAPKGAMTNEEEQANILASGGYPII